jgi:hypothetical protein
MTNKDVFDYIDRTLRSLYSGSEKDIPFAGKVVCSGDWKQRLPIVPGAKKPAILAATIKHSATYHLFETLPLTENMRIDADQVAFKQWCRATGNGQNFVAEGSEMISIPDEMLIDPDDPNAIVDFFFPADIFVNPLARMRFTTCSFLPQLYTSIQMPKR